MGTDTDPLCQTGATTVDRDRPMRLHCRHDRAWPCPIGLVVALGGTVEAVSPAWADLNLYTSRPRWVACRRGELVAIDENAAEGRNAVLTTRQINPCRTQETPAPNAGVFRSVPPTRWSNENPFEGENVGIEHRLADNQTDSDIYASRDNGRYG